MGKTKNFSTGPHPDTGKEYFVIENNKGTLSIINTAQTRVGAEKLKLDSKKFFPKRKYYIVEKQNLFEKVKTVYIQKEFSKQEKTPEGQLSTKYYTRWVPKVKRWDKRYNCDALINYLKENELWKRVSQ